LTEKAGDVVGVSTGLFGAGGFGKTTLARQVCWSGPVRRRFRSAVWVTLGDQLTPADLLSKIDSVARADRSAHGHR
jgi:MoxR-like ATPase